MMEFVRKDGNSNWYMCVLAQSPLLPEINLPEYRDRTISSVKISLTQFLIVPFLKSI